MKHTTITLGRSRSRQTGRTTSSARSAKTTERPAKASPRAPRAADRSGESHRETSRRPWIVLGSLVGTLAFTGALLKALAPAPLTPDATVSLFAMDQEQPIDRIFDTPTAIRAGRWRSIYIHHSRTASGNALALGQGAGGLPDHFLIGNGEGLTDGAIQTGPRWSEQQPVGTVPGVQISPDCLSICLVGDFNHVRPTPTQQARLLELVTALQRQLGIASDQVVLRGGDATVAGVGSRFPAPAFRAQLGQ
ncbi:MAG TPA: hypothetical protein VFC78_20790 [Tepidisphaeraceae bacterium]|nr:hypothetical protein [Tepidisphaeraceae bacterium]